MKKTNIVNFYNQIDLRLISKERLSYINSIDNIIFERIKNSNYSSILDIGAGDGVRVKNIADKAKLKAFALEISDKFYFQCKEIGLCSYMGDIDFFSFDKKFDVVTCLWSVLGYTDPKKSIINIKNALGEKGILFIDVNSRYNYLEYGIYNCTKNIAYDLLGKRYNKKFKVKKSNCEVYLFDYWELDKILSKNGLKYEKIYINYKTGKKTYPFLGQILYICTHDV